MKILIGMPSPDSWGGPIAAEPPFVEELRRLGHQVTEEIYVYGDREKPTPTARRISRVMNAARRLRRLVRNGNYAIVHLNTAFDLKAILRDSYTLFRVRKAGTRVFLKFHGSSARDFSGARFLIRSLINYIARNADGFGYHTDEELASFADLGFERSKFYKVRNVISIPTDPDEPSTAMDRSEAVEVLFAARFVPKKGLLETIEACAELRRRGIKFRLTCLGDGDVRPAAEAAVGRNGLERVVRFTGYVPEAEVRRQLRSTDVFCFPTTHDEGFPLVLFRAVALGLPIVTTRIRAAKEYLREPDNCLFCTDDPINIADRLQELIQDPGLRRGMSERNVELGRTLAPEPVAREYIQIYEQLVGSSRR